MPMGEHSTADSSERVFDALFTESRASGTWLSGPDEEALAGAPIACELNSGPRQIVEDDGPILVPFVTVRDSWAMGKSNSFAYLQHGNKRSRFMGTVGVIELGPEAKAELSRRPAWSAASRSTSSNFTTSGLAVHLSSISGLVFPETFQCSPGKTIPVKVAGMEHLLDSIMSHISGGAPLPELTLHCTKTTPGNVQPNPARCIASSPSHTQLAQKLRRMQISRIPKPPTTPSSAVPVLGSRTQYASSQQSPIGSTVQPPCASPPRVRKSPNNSRALALSRSTADKSTTPAQQHGAANEGADIHSPAMPKASASSSSSSTPDTATPRWLSATSTSPQAAAEQHARDITPDSSSPPQTPSLDFSVEATMKVQLMEKSNGGPTNSDCSGSPASRQWTTDGSNSMGSPLPFKLPVQVMQAIATGNDTLDALAVKPWALVPQALDTGVGLTAQVVASGDPKTPGELPPHSKLEQDLTDLQTEIRELRKQLDGSCLAKSQEGVESSAAVTLKALETQEPEQKEELPMPPDYALASPKRTTMTSSPTTAAQGQDVEPISPAGAEVSQASEEEWHSPISAEAVTHLSALSGKEAAAITTPPHATSTMAMPLHTTQAAEEATATLLPRTQLTEEGSKDLALCCAPISQLLRAHAQHMPSVEQSPLLLRTHTAPSGFHDPSARGPASRLYGSPGFEEEQEGVTIMSSLSDEMRSTPHIAHDLAWSSSPRRALFEQMDEPNLKLVSGSQGKAEGFWGDARRGDAAVAEGLPVAGYSVASSDLQTCCAELQQEDASATPAGFFGPMSRPVSRRGSQDTPASPPAVLRGMNLASPTHARSASSSCSGIRKLDPLPQEPTDPLRTDGLGMGMWSPKAVEPMLPSPAPAGAWPELDKLPCGDSPRPPLKSASSGDLHGIADCTPGKQQTAAAPAPCHYVLHGSVQLPAVTQPPVHFDLNQLSGTPARGTGLVIDAISPQGVTPLRRVASDIPAPNTWNASALPPAAALPPRSPTHRRAYTMGAPASPQKGAPALSRRAYTMGGAPWHAASLTPWQQSADALKPMLDTTLWTPRQVSDLPAAYPALLPVLPEVGPSPPPTFSKSSRPETPAHLPLVMPQLGHTPGTPQEPAVLPAAAGLYPVLQDSPVLLQHTADEAPQQQPAEDGQEAEPIFINIVCERTQSDDSLQGKTAPQGAAENKVPAWASNSRDTAAEVAAAAALLISHLAAARRGSMPQPPSTVNKPSGPVYYSVNPAFSPHLERTASGSSLVSASNVSEPLPFRVYPKTVLDVLRDVHRAASWQLASTEADVNRATARAMEREISSHCIIDLDVEADGDEQRSGSMSCPDSPGRISRMPAALAGTAHMQASSELLTREDALYSTKFSYLWSSARWVVGKLQPEKPSPSMTLPAVPPLPPVAAPLPIKRRFLRRMMACLVPKVQQ